MATYRNQNYARTGARAPIAQQPTPDSTAANSTADASGEKPIAFNGYQQVIEMLEAADPAFRESLLARLSRRDPELGRSLRAHFSQNRAGL